MADFLTAFQETMKIEGGYADDPRDTGGETWAGISRRNNPDWAGWKIIDSFKSHQSFPSILQKSAELQQLKLNFYKAKHFDSMSLGLLNNQQVANELFDTGVNMGVGVAKVYFQRVLNVVNLNGRKFKDLEVDGIIGRNTRNAFNGLNDSDQRMVWKLLNCLQGARYISICEANPSQEVFMRSWASRVFES